jgi:hypothetical protein
LAEEIRGRVHRTDGTFVVDFQPDHFHSTEYDSLPRNVDFIRRAIALSPFV